jgi:nucleoside-diphosphate-sugar epimerase
MGATPVLGDVFDSVRLDALVAQARPEIVIHQLTSFGATEGDPAAQTIRVRREGTRNLVAAASKAGVRRFIAQSISFICTPVRDGLTTEETPLYLESSTAIQALAQSVASLEDQTLQCGAMEGVVLRYGWFYGPGTNYDPADAIPRAIKAGRMAIVGAGDGTYSFVHVRDAALATMIALHRGASGIYNIVDDTPVKLREWLPFTAKLLGAPPPATLPETLAREKLGDLMVYVFNEQSGASNAKARRLLDWQPTIPSWQRGFERIFA